MIKYNAATGKNITIIGGNGLMGQLFSRYWTTSGAIVRSLGRNDWPNAEALLSTADLVVICVPIHDTCDIITRVCKFISPNTILADLTSIKQVIINHMLKEHTGSILGLHPMFGPTISEPNTQVIINCGGRDTEKSAWVIDSLRQIGFSIRNMSAEEHDLVMSFIQGIEHFSTFALGTFLKDKNIHPQDLFGLSSPIYQAKLALLGRIFDQDANLYADIIMSDSKRIELISQYVEHMQTWLNKIKSSQRDEFVQEFGNTSKWMGDFTHQSQLSSDHFLNEVSNSFKK